MIQPIAKYAASMGFGSEGSMIFYSDFSCVKAIIAEDMQDSIPRLLRITGSRKTRHNFRSCFFTCSFTAIRRLLKDNKDEIHREHVLAYQYLARLNDKQLESWSEFAESFNAYKIPSIVFSMTYLRIFDITMSLAPLRLPNYIVLWILDWIFNESVLTHIKKLRLIENIQSFYLKTH